MASPHSQAPTPASSALHIAQAPWAQTAALDTLANSGLSEEQIIALRKLGVDGLQKLRKLEEHNLDSLLWVLTDMTEESIRDRMQRREPTRGRSPFPRPAARATPAPAPAPATDLLVLPTSSYRRSSTSRPTSESPSASTSITHPSHPSISRKRVKLTPRTPRKWLHCPHCEKKLKNGFEDHIRKEHLANLLDGVDLGDPDILIGCGYCPCEDLELDQGQAPRGIISLLQHIRDKHSQPDSPAPVPLRWEFNRSFKNVLTAEGLIRRSFLTLIKEKNRNLASRNPPAPPYLLSWQPTATTRHLLNGLQKLGGKIFQVPFTHVDLEDKYNLKDLLYKAYDAAYKRQPSLEQSPMQSLGPPPPQRPQQQLQPQQQPQQQPHHPPLPRLQHSHMDLASIGEGASDASQYPSFPSADGQFPPATPLSHGYFDSTQASPDMQFPLERPFSPAADQLPMPQSSGRFLDRPYLASPSPAPPHHGPSDAVLNSHSLTSWTQSNLMTIDDPFSFTNLLNENGTTRDNIYLRRDQ